MSQTRGAAREAVIQLYGSPITRAQRVMWMLEELGLVYEHIPAGVPSELGPVVPAEQVKRLNPSGKLPILIDEGYLITESLAINLYLATKYAGNLSPSSPEEWGRTFQWTSWVLNEVDKDLQAATLVRRRGSLDGLGPEEAQRDAALRDAVQATLRTLDAALERREWLAADRFSVADLNVAAVLALAEPSGVSLEALPKLRGWLREALARPAARRAWGAVVRDAVAHGFVGDLKVADRR